MATLKGAQITKLSASPAQMVDNKLNRAPVFFSGESYTKPASGITNADIIRMIRVWSGDIILALEFETAAWGASGVIEIGVFDTEDNNSGAAIDADLFASSIDVSAAVAKIDLLREATDIDALERIVPIWQAAGLSSDPQKWMDIVVTATNIGAAQAAKFNIHTRFLKGGG